ncbi:hypothetical protein GUJ93_ZPchr0011g27600 [Zizania palustris]|uniref:Phosphomannomutase n=1 Tax=Zizania palustris TaxID=103762 RepID=A0A8J5WII8_ZIZPA|nr:hypothetical protein GUJ93_ZPchr0011g27600 [Zizania palustris]
MELGLLSASVITDYDYCFSENGLVAHKNDKLVGTQSLKSFLGDDKLKEFINFTLHYIADLDIPIKRPNLNLQKLPIRRAYHIFNPLSYLSDLIY